MREMMVFELREQKQLFGVTGFRLIAEFGPPFSVMSALVAGIQSRRVRAVKSLFHATDVA